MHIDVAELDEALVPSKGDFLICFNKMTADFCSCGHFLLLSNAVIMRGHLGILKYVILPRFSRTRRADDHIVVVKTGELCVVGNGDVLCENSFVFHNIYTPLYTAVRRPSLTVSFANIEVRKASYANFEIRTEYIIQ